MINLKKEDVKLSIAKLNSPKNFRKWQMGFNRYVGTLQLKYLLEYEVGNLYMRLTGVHTPTEGEVDRVKAKMQRNLSKSQVIKPDVYCKCPAGLRRVLQEGDTVQYFEVNEPYKVPDSILSLVLEGHVFIINNRIFMMFDDGREFLKFKVQLATNIDKLFTLIQSTVEGRNQEIVRTKRTPKEAYEYFCQKFGRSPILELKELRQKFRSIRCPNLRDYVHTFEMQLAEYSAGGGDDTEVALFDVFLETTLDEALHYFCELGERE